MALLTDPAQVVRFSVFELDLRTGELRKTGVRVPLQDQPLEILKALLERPGELITRDELRQRLWHDDTFVDFEDGLNAAIRRLREALGDDATTPRFVETLPRRGYRFIAPRIAEPIATAELASSQSASLRSAGHPRMSARQMAYAALTAVLIVVVVLIWRDPRRNAPVRQPTSRFAVSTRPLAVLVHAQSPVVALAPDGTQLAYVSGESDRGQLYVRRLDSLDAKAVPGAGDVQGPFFSPDGQWIAFFTRRHLQKIFLAGGSAVNICAVPGWLSGAHGGSWGDDGTIVFESLGRLWRVSAHGGTAEPIPAEGSFAWPQLLPGSRTVLLTGTRGADGERARDGIWLLSLDSGRLQRILPEGGLARYVRSGHVLYASKGSLFAAPFDLGNPQLAGSATPVVPGAMMGLPAGDMIAHFAVSETGTLAYLGGPVLEGLRTLAWVDRQGLEQVLPVEPRQYNWPRLSPDGSRVALSVVESGREGRSNEDVWVYDLGRQTLTRVTSDPAIDARPLWTPDGERVIFRSYRDGPLQSNLFSQPAAATRPAERLTREPNPDRTAFAILPDGKQLLVTHVGSKETGMDIHTVRLDEQGASAPLLHDRFNEASPAISPDGMWLAYRSNETGRYEVYVRPFPEVHKGKWQISSRGGNAPLWSPDGRELFFDDGDMMMAMTVAHTTRGLTPGPQKALFRITGKYFTDAQVRNRHYDVSRDGRRFLMVKEIGPTVEPSARDQLTVVLNWFEELRQLVPANNRPVGR